MRNLCILKPTLSDASLEIFSIKHRFPNIVQYFRRQMHKDVLGFCCLVFWSRGQSYLVVHYTTKLFK